MDKDTVRNQAKAYRQSLLDKEYLDESKNIQTKIINYIKKTKPQNVHCYTAIVENREVDTNEVLEYLKNSRLIKNLHTTFMIDGEWQHADVKSGDLVSSVQYDLIIAPMLAGDATGNRLGYGFGFYDKFLAAQENATKIGLCYKKCMFDIVPTEPHDQKLDKIVTE